MDPPADDPPADGYDWVGADGLSPEELAAGSVQSESADTPDAEMDKIADEKKNMSVAEKLDHSIRWKAEGNDFFKKSEIFKAADSYYHAILYCRELTQNPEYYPKIGHTKEQRKVAQDLCESVFTNLALVQTKYATSLPLDHYERPKALHEAVKSATEALKLNAKNVKAMYRRGVARAALARGPVENAEGQQLCTEAKSDFLAALEEDKSNRDARSELKAIQEHLKKFKKEEIAGERKEFSFASTLSALGPKEKDLLGDGSVKKQQVKAGDGGNWLNNDWLKLDSPTKCVVHIQVTPQGAKNASLVSVSYALGDPDMHEGLTVAVKSMTLGEVANFTFTSERLTAKSALTTSLPSSDVTWQVSFLKFVTWEDLDRDGARLQKVLNEGYGNFPELLSELYVHWRVFAHDGKTVHSSRYTLSVGGEGSLKQVEDEDKQPMVMVLGENAWEPVAILCRALRQGGVGELRLRQVPELPKQDASSGDATSAEISMMMNRSKGSEALQHCTVRVELERVVQPIAGPEDSRWEGTAALVQERFHAEQLLEKDEDLAALKRFSRVVAWAEQLPPDDAAVRQELAAARTSSGWILVRRAAPVLDGGNVKQSELATARKELAEAEAHCAWLEEHHPNCAGTRLLRAKILVAEDDDFVSAHSHLMEAQKLAPSDKRVQEELRQVKAELRRLQEETSRAKVVEIREGLRDARKESSDAGRARIVSLLQELSETKVSWDTVMDTRIGVEIKSCQEEGGEETKRLCTQILARFKDESKEQRPMWET